MLHDPRSPEDIETERRKETVNHPQHYGGDTTYEAIKVIDAWGLNFALGNAVKYICRAPHKGSELEDLKKALWYLDWQIRKLEKERDPGPEKESRGFANP